MCTPIGKHTIYIDTLQPKTKDFKEMAKKNGENNRNDIRFIQELFFNAIIGISIFALLFGFIVLIKVLIG